MSPEEKHWVEKALSAAEAGSGDFNPVRSSYLLQCLRNALEVGAPANATMSFSANTHTTIEIDPSVQVVCLPGVNRFKVVAK